MESLVAMLQLMWPNPDRHGGRNPDMVEGRAVMHLALTIVQWARAGAIYKK